MTNPYPPTRPEPNQPFDGQYSSGAQPSWQQPPSAPFSQSGPSYPSAPSGGQYAAGQYQGGYQQLSPYSSGSASYGQPVPYQGSPYAPHPFAPYGMDPMTGMPWSDKSKVVAGLLQIFLGSLAIGRFYTGHIGIAIAQILVTIFTFGIGSLWGLIDGIVILAGSPRDSNGRPLRN